MAEPRIALLRRALLDWYDRHRRVLPWRPLAGQAPDVYRVWVSEVMLQQTRVDTVQPYYERWIRRFPDLPALASASQDEVLKAWEGLGYYARARHFHRAAQLVHERHEGRVPSDPAVFRSLPGVGAYTAGAVMSIGFGLREPVVDGNVRRVFARLLDEPTPAQDRLWKLAGRLVQGERPGDLNQALMELGALVCTPRNPQCEDCPVRTHCRSVRAGTVEQRPAARASRPIPTEHLGVAIIGHAGRFLIVRRPSSGRLASLWEFPSDRAESTHEAKEAARSVARRFLGVAIEPMAALPEVRHALTHVRLVYHPFRFGTDFLPPTYPGEARWATPGELGDVATPRAQRRIADLLAG